MLLGILMALSALALGLFLYARFRRPRFPKVGEVFTLTAKEEITGLSLVTDFGYDSKGWRTIATTIKAGTTGRFVLLSVGYQPSRFRVDRACMARAGGPVSGCWLKVFDEKFGSNGYNPVGVADPSWLNPGGLSDFPVVYEGGERRFHSADSDYTDRWVWLCAA